MSSAFTARGRPSHVRWNILALLVLLSFVAYLLRTNMSIAGDRMMGDLGLSQVQLGWILPAFAWGYAIFQLPGGIRDRIMSPVLDQLNRALADRYRIERTVRSPRGPGSPWPFIRGLEGRRQCPRHLKPSAP